MGLPIGQSDIAAMAGAEVIKLQENRGKANAVMRGLARIKNQNYDVVVLIDADGQHNSDEIVKIVQPVLDGEADLVIGSRFIANTHQIPMYRQIGQRVLNKATSIGARKKVTDTQSGFRALNTNAMQNMDFTSDGYGLESSMIVHFASRGLKIKEVPISVSYDVPHKHKKHPVTMGFGLMNHVITLVSLKRPLMYIGVPGVTVGILGLMLGFACINGAYLFGWSWIFESILAGFMTTMGAILAISSLTLNSIAHIIGTPNTDFSEALNYRRDEDKHGQKMAEPEANKIAR